VAAVTTSRRLPNRPIAKRFRSAAETAAATLLAGIAGFLPRPWLTALGSCAGELAFRLDRRHTKVALSNLERAYGPAMSEAERRRIARACWRHYGRITADTAAFPRLTQGDIGTRIRYDGVDALKGAYEEGKGVLLVMAHFGHWELIAYMQAFLGYPLVGIAKTLENPRLEAMLVKLRTGSGNVAVPKEGGVRAALRALAAGRGMVVMIDQDARESGIFIPFFGRPASTISTVGTMHVRTGAAVVAAFSYPEPGGVWRVEYRRLTFPNLSGDTERDVRRITIETTELLEARIREHPELWLWMHRRWKTKPPESPRPT